MTVLYTPTNDYYLRQKAADEGRDFELTLCSDGIYRTPDEKTAFEAAAKSQTRILTSGA